MSLTLARASVFIRADASMFSADLARSRAAILASTRRLGKSIGSTLQGAFAGIGAVGLIRGFASMISSGEEFERKMRNSVAIMGDVTEEYEKMRQAAFETGRTTRFSAAGAAEAFYFLASAGLDAKQSLAGLPQVAKFAQAGVFDLAVATELLTDAQAAMGMTTKDAGENLKNMTRVSDVLVKANTLADASVQEFALSLTRKAGAAGRIAKMEIEEVVAVLAAFAKQGTKSYLGGQAFNIVLRDLTTKAIVNKAAFKKLGVEVYTSTGKLNKMSDIIGDLEKMTQGLTVEQTKQRLRMLGLTDKSLIFTQTLMGTSREIKEFEERLHSAGGTTSEVASKQLTPLQQVLARLGSEATKTGTLFMESFGPHIYAVLDSIAIAVKGLGKALTGLSGEIIAATTVLGLFITSIRVARTALVMLGISTSATGKALSRLGVAIKLVKIAISGIVFGAVLTSIAAAVVGISKFIKYLFTLSEVQKAVKDSMDEFIYAWSDLRQSMEFVRAGLANATKALINWLGELVGVSTAGQEFAVLIRFVADTVKTIGIYILGLTSDFQKAWEAISLGGAMAFLAIENVLHNFVQVFVNAFNVVYAVIKKKWDEIIAISTSQGNFIGVIFAGVFNVVKSFFKEIGIIIVGRFAQLGVIVTGAIGTIGVFGKSLVQTMKLSFTAMRNIARITFSWIIRQMLVTGESMARMPEFLLAAAAGKGKDAAAEIFTEFVNKSDALTSRVKGKIAGAMMPASTVLNQALLDAKKNIELIGDKAEEEFEKLGAADALERLKHNVNNFGTEFKASVLGMGKAMANAFNPDSFINGFVAIDNAITGMDFSNVFDIGDTARGLFPEIRRQFDAIFERGEWFHLWEEQAQDFGKVAGDVKEAIAEPVVIPIKWEWMGYDELQRQLQEEILGMKKKGEDAAEGVADAIDDAGADGGGGGGEGAGKVKTEEELARERRVDRQRRMAENVPTPGLDKAMFETKQLMDEFKEFMLDLTLGDVTKSPEKFPSMAFPPVPLSEEGGPPGFKIPDFPNVPMPMPNDRFGTNDPMAKVLTESEKQTIVQNQMLVELRKTKSTTLALT